MKIRRKGLNRFKGGKKFTMEAAVFIEGNMVLMKRLIEVVVSNARFITFRDLTFDKKEGWPQEWYNQHTALDINYLVVNREPYFYVSKDEFPHFVRNNIENPIKEGQIDMAVFKHKID